MFITGARPPKPGEMVLVSGGEDVRPRLARYYGWRNGRQLLHRLDGVPLAVKTTIMVKVVVIILESGPVEETELESTVVL